MAKPFDVLKFLCEISKSTNGFGHMILTLNS